MTLRPGQHEPLDALRQRADEHALVASIVAESQQPSLLAFMNLFPEFRASSWDAWRAVLTRIGPRTREFWAIAGRGSGKSRIVALLASYFGTRRYPRVPGEFIYVGVFAPDRRQAGITFNYIVGLLKSVPSLAALIVGESKERVELSNGVVIEVITASIAAPRGRTYALAIIEEAAFLPDDESANPDRELVAAVRPALARMPGSMLAVVTTGYARKGITWTATQKYDGRPDDGETVYVRASTLALNPAFDRRAIELAYAEDSANAAAEYGGEFRSDIESFVSREAIDDCVVRGRHELLPVHGVSYEAFVDAAGGSGADSMTLAIGHVEHRGEHMVVIIDCVREDRPPFSPSETVGQFAGPLKTYGVHRVTGDRYAGEWPREQFRKHGITYEPAEAPKSDLYRDALALLNSGRLELLDHARLVTQLAGLERRVGRGGRDSIDHAPGGHDDLANCVAGLAVMLTVRARHVSPLWPSDRPRAASSQPRILMGPFPEEPRWRWVHPLGDQEERRLANGGEPLRIPWYERVRIGS